MIDHVNHTKHVSKEKSKVPVIPEKKSFLDEYDEAGNYIKDDPNLMDSESETNNNNWIAQSYIRHEDFRPPSSSVLLCNAQGTPPLKSETGWTGELWSSRVLVILEN